MFSIYALEPATAENPSPSRPYVLAGVAAEVDVNCPTCGKTIAIVGEKVSGVGAIKFFCTHDDSHFVSVTL